MPPPPPPSRTTERYSASATMPCCRPWAPLRLPRCWLRRHRVTDRQLARSRLRRRMGLSHLCHSLGPLNTLTWASRSSRIWTARCVSLCKHSDGHVLWQSVSPVVKVPLVLSFVSRALARACMNKLTNERAVLFFAPPRKLKIAPRLPVQILPMPPKAQRTYGRRASCALLSVPAAGSPGAPATPPPRKDGAVMDLFVRPSCVHRSEGCGALAPSVRRNKRPATAALDRKDAQARKRPLRQLYLDFGQRDFGCTVCDRCGMAYAVGEPEDEKKHAVFCKRAVAAAASGVLVPRCSELRAVEQRPDGLIAALPAGAESGKWASLVLSLQSAMGEDLGMFRSSAGEGGTRRYFLFIKGQHAVGCISVERIRLAHRVLVDGVPVAPDTTPAPSAAAVPSATPAPSSEHDAPVPGHAAARFTVGNAEVPATLGVCQVWVHAAHRRQHVATQLLDAARRHALYGFPPVPVQECAFSQPTESGRAFAAAYCGTEEFLVYS